MQRRAVATTFAVVLVAGVAAVLGVRAFVDAYPARWPHAWRLLHDWDGGWRAAFAAGTAGADGLRISDTFERDRPRLRFETHDAGLARGFLDLVRIDEPWSGFGCTGDCCSGEYAIDVLRGSGVAVTLRITSGRALRSGELWPGDAALTGDSAEAVCAWLVAHGVDVESPRAEAARFAAEETALCAAQDALLGRERGEALRACADDAAVAALLAEWAPDAADRIVLAVRFLAVDGSNARGAGGRAYEGVETCLHRNDDYAAAAAAFDRLLADDAVATSAADRFESFDWFHGGEFPAEALPGLRMRAARLLIASRIEYHRIQAVRMLGRIGATPEVRAILLGLLPPAGDDDRPAAPTPDDRMEAALLVAQFCDPSMFPRLQEMADGARDSDRWTERMGQRIAARREATETAPPK